MLALQGYFEALEDDELARRVAASFDHPFVSFIDTHNLVGLPGGSSETNMCSNVYGATFNVPLGSYDGNDIIALTSFSINPFPGLAEQQIVSHAGGAWSFEPGNLLVRETQTVFAHGSDVGGAPFSECGSVIRYRLIGPNGVTYFQNKGLEVLCNFRIDNTSDASVCFGGYPASCSVPTQFWSTNGQIMLDVSNPSSPVLRYPDGSVEIMGLRAEGFSPITIPFVAHHASMFDQTSQSSWRAPVYWVTTRLVDRNGNQTTYSYDANTGWLASITDQRGRATTYIRDPDGSSRITSITKTGPSGAVLRWQMSYSTLSFNPSDSFPDVQCYHNAQLGPCPVQSFTTLTGLTIPDQRSYVFSYGPWGNLTQVVRPEGAVFQIEYGDSNTTSFQPPGFQTCANNPLNRRRVTSKTAYPQGLSGPAFTTTTRHASEETIGSLLGDTRCSKIRWIRDTFPDGAIKRTGICAQENSRIIPFEGRTIAEETSRGGVLIEGVYFGNTGTIGDSSPIGTMFMTWETGSGPVGQASQSGTDTPLDVRPTKVVHFRDGTLWTETLNYEGSNITADGGKLRTLGNVTVRNILNQNSTQLASTETTFFHPATYLSKNLLRLPASVRQVDPSRGLLSLTNYTYDEYDRFPLVASGAPNLDTTIGSVRGNVSTVTSYGDAASATGPVSSETHYFDTGDVQQAKDPNHNATSMGYDFGVCSVGHTMLTSTVTNAKGHQTITVSDCFTGAPLRVTDPNNQSVYTQYDNLGRVVETAGPGDTLTPLAGFTRDPSAPLNGGSVVGNNGQGPTTWNEYFRFGLEVFNINQQRTVAHAKDGSADGRYVKTFLDGLGRPTQTRSEVDPATSSGNGEDVATTEYDNMGRVSKVYVPVFSSASDSYVAPASGALATITGYDALGRIASLQPPGLPASTTTYGNSGALFLTTAIDANSNQTLTLTDVLGRTVQISRQSDTCLGNWCITTMDYDAAGRLLQTTDPANNHVTFIYDGLGRKKSMTDPDMGTWLYEYDDNGNLKKQTDAKGQIILMAYDVLNRITRKDLPPNDPVNTGPEDTTYFYDGEGPAP
jgi:YD repeat-containing protein